MSNIVENAIRHSPRPTDRTTNTDSTMNGIMQRLGYNKCLSSSLHLLFPFFSIFFLFFLLMPATTGSVLLPRLPKTFSEEDRLQVQQRVDLAMACKHDYPNKEVKEPAFLKSSSTTEYKNNNNHCSSVPTIIHQTWKTKDMPAEYQPYHRSWIDKNPGKSISNQSTSSIIRKFLNESISINRSLARSLHTIQYESNHSRLI